jgi:hypothetical protein
MSNGVSSRLHKTEPSAKGRPGEGLAPPKFRLAAIALAAMCVTACIHVEHPPASWGNFTPAMRSEDCASLAATYSNHGERSDGLAVLLATWLYPRKAPTRGIDKDLIEAETVTLELAGTILTVTMNGPRGAFHQWSFDESKHQFACVNGGLRISQGGDKSGQNVAAVGSDAIDLYRTQSDLIVNSHGSEVGIALMIPMGDSYSVWARFTVQKSGDAD